MVIQFIHSFIKGYTVYWLTTRSTSWCCCCSAVNWPTMRVDRVRAPVVIPSRARTKCSVLNSQVRRVPWYYHSLVEHTCAYVAHSVSRLQSSTDWVLVPLVPAPRPMAPVSVTAVPQAHVYNTTRQHLEQAVGLFVLLFNVEKKKKTTPSVDSALSL
jgi:hypothetical protein